MRRCITDIFTCRQVGSVIWLVVCIVYFTSASTWHSYNHWAAMRLAIKYKVSVCGPTGCSSRLLLAHIKHSVLRSIGGLQRFVEGVKNTFSNFFGQLLSNVVHVGSQRRRKWLANRGDWLRLLFVVTFLESWVSGNSVGSRATHTVRQSMNQAIGVGGIWFDCHIFLNLYFWSDFLSEFLFLPAQIFWLSCSGSRPAEKQTWTEPFGCTLETRNDIQSV